MKNLREPLSMVLKVTGEVPSINRRDGECGESYNSIVVLAGIED